MCNRLQFLLVMFLMATVLPACNRKMETATVKEEAPVNATESFQPETPGTEELPPSVVDRPIEHSATSRTMVVRMEDIFFDFDRATLREDAKGALQENAKFLISHPELKVKIEGHCDERGTEEYNLALGNRRAQVVKRFLIGLGVESPRISVISFGEEKPFCSDRSEVCYQQNRRGHFVTLASGR
jgi:peptidoglycan-associated lipoprotein